MKVKVYAKLNLTLNVYEKTGEFHPVDSLATSINLFDEVEVTLHSDGKIAVIGCKNIPERENSAYKAVQLFLREFSSFGADVTIKKGIPEGAGLGGSSADAAAVVYCMCKLLQIDVKSERVAEICARLGSDVNFMLKGGFCRMQGKGDVLQELHLPKPMHFSLVFFGEGADTAKVYSAFDTSKKIPFADNGEVSRLLQNGGFVSAFPLLSNGLTNGFLKVCRAADGFLKYAKTCGLPFNMTGSGSAFYFPFESAENAENFSRRLREAGFNAVTASSVPFGIEEI